MGYATFLNGGIAISNITSDEADALVAALAAALDGNTSSFPRYRLRWRGQR